MEPDLTLCEIQWKYVFILICKIYVTVLLSEICVFLSLHFWSTYSKYCHTETTAVSWFVCSVCIFTHTRSLRGLGTYPRLAVPFINRGHGAAEDRFLFALVADAANPLQLHREHCRPPSPSPPAHSLFFCLFFLCSYFIFHVCSGFPPSPICYGSAFSSLLMGLPFLLFLSPFASIFIP